MADKYAQSIGWDAQFVCGRFVLKWKKDGDFAVLGDGQTLISVLGNPSGTQAAFGGDKGWPLGFALHRGRGFSITLSQDNTTRKPGRTYAWTDIDLQDVLQQFRNDPYAFKPLVSLPTASPLPPQPPPTTPLSKSPDMSSGEKTLLRRLQKYATEFQKFVSKQSKLCVDRTATASLGQRCQIEGMQIQLTLLRWVIDHADTLQLVKNHASQPLFAVESRDNPDDPLQEHGVVSRVAAFKSSLLYANLDPRGTFRKFEPYFESTIAKYFTNPAPWGYESFRRLISVFYANGILSKSLARYRSDSFNPATDFDANFMEEWHEEARHKLSVVLYAILCLTRDPRDNLATHRLAVNFARHMDLQPVLPEFVHGIWTLDVHASQIEDKHQSACVVAAPSLAANMLPTIASKIVSALAQLPCTPASSALSSGTGAPLWRAALLLPSLAKMSSAEADEGAQVSTGDDDGSPTASVRREIYVARTQACLPCRWHEAFTIQRNLRKKDSSKFDNRLADHLLDMICKALVQRSGADAPNLAAVFQLPLQTAAGTSPDLEAEKRSLSAEEKCVVNFLGGFCKSHPSQAEQRTLQYFLHTGRLKLAEQWLSNSRTLHSRKAFYNRLINSFRLATSAK